MKMINELTTLEQWSEIWKHSMTTPIIIYKHSTSCMISARALKQVEAFQEEDIIDCYTVKVIENRPVSNQIAKDTEIPHKSPQILLIDKQQILWDTSHFKITKRRIEEAVQQLSNTNRPKYP
ncbi:bacillithiol system redox-active protein YtxJ [Gracilibacillus kekensis]|uniref:Bacillithiol system protein YtxJ n=1 Tax=Gracilibacillus kekensis TaxID=1027249 RepID=A0A1M7Q021_9BACI|nr:bacillithiol system redox-active protein YtxJ [Gracilibacillus kekensis]SHN23411.1 bacillithiol system protein YtxJ [Gracilibacillus kekensis]